MASVDYVDDTQLGIMYSGCVSRYICLPSCWNVLYMIYIKLKFLKKYFSLCAQLMMWFWWARGFSHSKLSCFGDSAFSSKLHGRALYHDLQQEELRSLWRAVLMRELGMYSEQHWLTVWYITCTVDEYLARLSNVRRSDCPLYTQNKNSMTREFLHFVASKSNLSNSFPLTFGKHSISQKTI